MNQILITDSWRDTLVDSRPKPKYQGNDGRQHVIYHQDNGEKWLYVFAVNYRYNPSFQVHHKLTGYSLISAYYSLLRWINDCGRLHDVREIKFLACYTRKCV